MQLEKAFGQTIREFRQSRGLTQEDLSFATGIDRSYLSEIENGHKSPSLQTIFSLGSGLGVQVSVLMRKVESRLTSSDPQV